MNTFDYIYIQRILGGDTTAFGIFVERYSHDLFVLIFRIVQNREDAEELTQDVFLKAFKNLASFKGDASFSSWLYRIAYNTAISATRKKKKEVIHLDENFLDNIPELEEEYEQDKILQLEKLENLLILLPPEEIALLTLYYTEDKSTEEIAQITGQSQANVKVKLFRTRKKLYTMLNSNTTKI